MAETGETEALEASEPAFETGAAAVAAALDEARNDPSTRPFLAEFFQSQKALIDAQRHHLRIQLRQLHLRTIGDGFRLALQAVSAVAVLGLLIAVGLILRDAVADHGLVIESFSAPPALAQRGFTGQALAEDMLGRIEAIRRRANANSITVSDDIRSGGADALKVEIPQTGLSLDEIDHFLHDHLGHARHLGGVVTDSGGGALVLDLHLTQSDPIVADGRASDLDGLMQQGAEKAFAAFDPVNYVLYLSSLKRRDEALAAAERNVSTARTPFQSALALCLAGAMDQDRRRALSNTRAAIQLGPQLWCGWSEDASASASLGHDEDMASDLRHELTVRAGDQWRNQKAALPSLLRSAKVRLDEATGDYRQARADLARTLPNDLDPLVDNDLSIADAAAAQHDCGAAMRALLLAKAAEGAVPESSLPTEWRLAVCRSDWRSALDEAEALLAADEAPGASGRAAFRAQTQDRPWLALSQARSGDLRGATATIATTPLDCYLCVRARGLISAAARQWSDADRWFAEAVRQAPDLPFGYEEWGETLAARGDDRSAVERFAAAHQKGPHFADPLKAWGDVLARRGRWNDALSKYEEALRYAPSWSALRTARDAAASR